MVMLAVEKSKDPYELVDPKFEGHNETEISYHIALLDDAGLLHGQDRSAIGVFRWSAGALTWAGHEFVEAIRDESVWKEARNIADRASKRLLNGEEHANTTHDAGRTYSDHRSRKYAGHRRLIRRRYGGVTGLC